MAIGIINFAKHAFNSRNLFLTAKLLKQGHRYHKIQKAFSKFYHRHSELIVGKPNFSDQFKMIVKRYIKVGYNLDVMRQSACLVLNPIMVYSYGFLFNCTTVG